MKFVNDSNLKSSIDGSDKTLVIVDYWAPWCGPCVQLGKILEFVDADNSEVEVLKINIDDNPIAGLGKTSIPVVEFYSRGRLLDRKVGALTRRQIIQLVDSFLADELQ
jgi:thioredoxin-like negative regulator of GroEL